MFQPKIIWLAKTVLKPLNHFKTDLFVYLLQPLYERCVLLTEMI